MRTELIDKWVRAYVGGTAVVDSMAPVLFYEDEAELRDLLIMDRPDSLFSRAGNRTGS